MAFTELPLHPASSPECPSDVACQLSERAWRELPHGSDNPASAQCESLWLRVRDLIDLHLTERQRQVLELYYLRGLDQESVATLLGISQQSVSEHLFGKRRNQRQVGGLVHKLRKLCARDGIAPGRTRIISQDEADVGLDEALT